MKQIPLTQGKFALVDDEDYEELSKYKWCASKARGTFYAVRAAINPLGKRKSILMHRQILDLINPKINGDHKNGNGLDNQRHNLRACSHSENQRNSKIGVNNTVGFKGVSFQKQRQKFRAYISIDGKFKHIGCYVCPIEAAKAYDAAAKQIYGEFARLNFPKLQKE